MVSCGDQLDRGGTGGEDPVEAGTTGIFPNNGTLKIISSTSINKK